MLSAAGGFAGIMILCLFYHNILETWLLVLQKSINAVVEFMLIFQISMLAIAFSVVFTWALLACVITDVHLTQRGGSGVSWRPVRYSVAVSKPTFATKGSFCSSVYSIHTLLHQRLHSFCVRIFWAVLGVSWIPTSAPLQTPFQVINPTLVGYLVMIAGVAIVVRVLVGKIGDLQGMVDEVEGGEWNDELTDGWVFSGSEVSQSSGVLRNT